MPTYVVHVGPIVDDRPFATYQVEAEDVYEARAMASRRLRDLASIEVKRIIRVERADELTRAEDARKFGPLEAPYQVTIYSTTLERPLNFRRFTDFDEARAWGLEEAAAHREQEGTVVELLAVVLA